MENLTEKNTVTILYLSQRIDEIIHSKRIYKLKIALNMQMDKWKQFDILNRTNVLIDILTELKAKYDVLFNDLCADDRLTLLYKYSSSVAEKNKLKEFVFPSTLTNTEKRRYFLKQRKLILFFSKKFPLKGITNEYIDDICETFSDISTFRESVAEHISINIKHRGARK